MLGLLTLENAWIHHCPKSGETFLFSLYSFSEGLSAIDTESTIALLDVSSFQRHYFLTFSHQWYHQETFCNLSFIVLNMAYHILLCVLQKCITNCVHIQCLVSINLQQVFLKVNMCRFLSWPYFIYMRFLLNCHSAVIDKLKKKKNVYSWLTSKEVGYKYEKLENVNRDGRVQ